MLVVLAAVAGYAGYRMVRGDVAEQVYLGRLTALRDDYESLRDRYNEAVRKTAVTELLVRDGRVCVTIRDASGAVRTIETGADAGREVYVDYVVIDGRLWIRRVFDAATPAERATVIDPARAEVSWDADGAVHGKAIYRKLDEGRWTITVTGDGSLGLARTGEGETAELASAPRVKDYSRVEREAAAAAGRVGPLDVVRHLLGG